MKVETFRSSLQSLVFLTLWVLLTLLLTACTSVPKSYQIPAKWTEETVSLKFKHQIFAKPITAVVGEYGSRLHVYIEGDGWPFINRIQVSPDPTPSDPLTFSLMSLDPTPSINLGRPCYFQSLNTTHDSRCTLDLWTSNRYSSIVVEDMVAALHFYLAKHPYSKVTLIGYSGGGTLAILMAKQMPEVDQLVTVAGGLNTTAWLDYHHYSPMQGSLNPAEVINSAQPKYQLHLTGAKDTNIPAKLAEDFLAQLGFSYWVFEDADHGCCWVRHWPEVLARLQSAK